MNFSRQCVKQLYLNLAGISFLAFCIVAIPRLTPGACSHCSALATVAPEPAAAVAFRAAYALGDEATAESVASPLYQAEWQRWDLSTAERTALLPHRRTAAGAPAPWVRFSYIASATDSRGFRHLLYTIQAIPGTTRTSLGIWRMDTDPNGKVIWCEMVRAMGDGVSAVVPITGDLAHAPVVLPADLLAQHPRLLMGLKASTGNEGYYAVESNRPLNNGTFSTPGTTVTFFAIDEYGDFLPGAWTYGQQHPGLATYGHQPVVPSCPFPPNRQHFYKATSRVSKSFHRTSAS